MSLSARRWLVAVASGALCAACSSAASADPLFDPINAVDRPLTLPAHQLAVAGVGAARHLEDGTVFASSGLGGSYGVTDRFEVQFSPLNAEYAPDTRLLGPSGSATYALLNHGLQLGLRFTVGGVLTPNPGALLQLSLPIRIAVGSRVRVDLGPQVPVVVTSHPVVGVVAPFGVTVRLADVAFVHFDTAAALYDVTARSVVVPARISFEVGMHVTKSVPLSFSPFFAFPTLFTPGDESAASPPNRHVHPKDYAGGLGIGTWFRL